MIRAVLLASVLMLSFVPLAQADHEETAGTGLHECEGGFEVWVNNFRVAECKPIPDPDDLEQTICDIADVLCDADPEGLLEELICEIGALLEEPCEDPDADSDGDGVPNGDDNCPTTHNPGQEDMDGDGIGDACDPDRDGDGIDNDDDNCPDHANANQADSDGDGVGDVCDPDTVDTDGDGVVDEQDNCPDDANQDQADADNDGHGDVCDAFPNDPDEHLDTDGDGRGDNADNCPMVANTNQGDQDTDGVGDACDPDIDGDGVPQHTVGSGFVPECGSDADDEIDRYPFNAAEWYDDDCDGVGNNADPEPNDPDHSVDTDGDGVADGLDNCPNFVNPDQKDSDDDGAGDVCDDSDGDGVSDAFDDNDGDGLLNADDNCPNVANPGQQDSDGDGKGDACDSIPQDGPKGDLDGDGFSNEQETAAGTDPADATSFPGTTLPPAVAKDVAESLRGTLVTEGNLSVELTFSAPSSAQGIHILRSTSPWQVIATLPKTATSFTDESAMLGAKYIAVSYGAGGPIADPELELNYLDTLLEDGDYYEAVKPVEIEGDEIVLRNGNGVAQEIKLVFDVLDGTGKVLSVKDETATVPAHGEKRIPLEVDSPDGAKYNVYTEGLDGQRTLVGSGAIKEAPGIDPSILWIVAGGALLALILVVAIAGIIAYARQEPEEVVA